MRRLLVVAAAAVVAAIVVGAYHRLSSGAAELVFPLGLGFPTGAAVWIANKRQGDWRDGTFAVAATLTALVVGRALAVDRQAARDVALVEHNDVADRAAGDDVLLELCDEIARDWSDEGAETRLPQGVALATARPWSYSPKVWDAAVETFDAMTEEERLEVRHERESRRALLRSSGELKARFAAARAIPTGRDAVFAGLEALAAGLIGSSAFGRRRDDRPNSEQLADAR